MTPKELYHAFQNGKNQFTEYIEKQKKLSPVDFFTIINPTLIANPNVSDFPQKFFKSTGEKSNKFTVFFINTIKFYAKNSYRFLLYLAVYILFKIYRKKRVRQENNSVLIDVFFLADKIIKADEYQDPYFNGLYAVLEKHNIGYTFLPRIYGLGKNPFKIKKLLDIINQDTNSFLFEFDLLSVGDLLKIAGMIAVYPFKTLRLLKSNSDEVDELYSSELLSDISKTDLNAFVRYRVGLRIGEQNNYKTIYSWSEFQVTERAFNYGVRTQNSSIEIIACQFFLNYPVYFNTIVHDIDDEQLSAPNKVLVNGSYYLQEREKVKYDLGVSLRYKELYTFDISKSVPKDIVLLGSYIENDTISMLKSVQILNKKIIFKGHPALSVKKIEKYMDNNIEIMDKPVYDLFKTAKLIITTASGTSLEALACGVSVIILASQDNLTANPLPDYGQGKMWDIVFEKDEIVETYNSLMNFREGNEMEIRKMAEWYKDNFFVEPTETNIEKIVKGIRT